MPGSSKPVFLRTHALDHTLETRFDLFREPKKYGIFGISGFFEMQRYSLFLGGPMRVNPIPLNIKHTRSIGPKYVFQSPKPSFQG
jgi:hypothetical protein